MNKRVDKGAITPTDPSVDVISPFSDDKLDRKSVADYLTTYLNKKYAASQDNARYKSFVLNVNSEWGFGKTYFLLEWKKQLESEKYPVVYFDAWKNDFSDQPLIAFMSEIEEQLRDRLPKTEKMKAGLKELIRQGKNITKASLPLLAIALAKGFTGVDLSDFDLSEVAENADLPEVSKKISEKLKEQLYEENHNIKKAIEAFKAQLGVVIELIAKSEKFCLPLFIFVDELDRCRPTYSIRLLEDIKHVFGVDGIYFVVATDSVQLSHSIKTFMEMNSTQGLT